MGRDLTPMDLNAHRDESIDKLNNYLISLINSPDAKTRGKADKLCFWIKDYVKYLEHEPNFKPQTLNRFKRGDIIKLHLGYNIGSEQGGLHYAIVLNNKDTLYSPVITVVPLTSVKSKTNINNLGKGKVYIGDELFRNMHAKITARIACVKKELNDLKEKEKSGELDGSFFREKMSGINKEFDLIERDQKEFERMKKGSIALINQITTVSKIRIYDPRNSSDALSGIRLSTISLNLINESIISNIIYTNDQNSQP